MRRPGRRHRHAGSAGFTLIDILIAFLIFAIGMAAILGGLAGAARTETRVTFRSQASDVARSRLDQIGHSIALRPGRRDGTAPGGIAWREMIAPAIVADDARSTSPQLPAQQAYWVSVTAAARDGTEITLSTLKRAEGGIR